MCFMSIAHSLFETNFDGQKRSALCSKNTEAEDYKAAETGCEARSVLARSETARCFL